MYTFRSGAIIDKQEKIKLVKLYKQIKNVLPTECYKSDEIREGLENLLVETIISVPNVLYVVDDEEKCLIDLVVENKLWGALFEIAKKQEFANIINDKLTKAQSKSVTELNK